MRRGVSLLEVLFSILVTTIGLFGAVAMLTASGSQVKKGIKNDAISVLAPRAVHEFDTRGWRQTANWKAWNQTAGIWQAYAPQFGESICIDPRFMAANSATPVTASVFPYVPATGTQVRMRRVTLDRMNSVLSGTSYIAVPSGVPMGKLVSDSLFTFSDDLSYTRPDDNSIAPVQTMDGTARRQTAGEYSWMATISPQSNFHTPIEAAFIPRYTVSIVIFHQRPAGLELTGPNEQVCGVNFTGGGVTGGEALLTSTSTIPVKSGDWVMAMGWRLHVDRQASVSGAQTASVPVFRWYRVSDAEAESATVTGGFERYVSLAGQDWDTGLFDQQIMLMDGVVGVYEKTIHLE